MSEEMNLNGIQELGLEEMEAVSGGKSNKEQIKATGDLNVRTGPGLGYGILGSIKKGEKLPEAPAEEPAPVTRVVLKRPNKFRHLKFGDNYDVSDE